MRLPRVFCFPKIVDLQQKLQQNISMRHDYRLFKRKGSNVWYFYYYDGDTRSFRSTGQVRKYEAEKVAAKFLSRGARPDIERIHINVLHSGPVRMDQTATREGKTVLCVHGGDASRPPGQLHLQTLRTVPP